MPGHAVPSQHLVKIQPVNGAETVKPVHGGDGAFIFDVRQPAQRNDELIAAVAGGDLLTGLLHIAISQLQPVARALELFSCTVHVMILAVTPPQGRTTASKGLPLARALKFTQLYPAARRLSRENP